MPNLILALKGAARVFIFAIGFAISSNISSGKISALNEKLGSYEETISSMGALVTEQNSGIEEIKRLSAVRAAAAQSAILAARAGQHDAESIARDILSHKPPHGSDECSAASSEFDVEIRLERK